MSDEQALVFVLENAEDLEPKTLDAFADMAMKVRDGAQLSHRQRTWVDQEVVKTTEHLAKIQKAKANAARPRVPATRDKEFAHEPLVQKINCGPLPSFPPGMGEKSRRFGESKR